jgi:hypothetical protein
LISKQHRGNVLCKYFTNNKIQNNFFSLKLKIKKVEKKGAKIFFIGRMSKVKQDEKHNNSLFGR